MRPDILIKNHDIMIASEPKIKIKINKYHHLLSNGQLHTMVKRVEEYSMSGYVEHVLINTITAIASHVTLLPPLLRSKRSHRQLTPEQLAFCFVVVTCLGWPHELLVRGERLYQRIRFTDRQR